MSTIPDVFFLKGDGEIKLSNPNSGRSCSVKLFTADQRLNSVAFDEIDRVFGFPTKEKGEHISLRTIFMLDYFSDQVAPGKTIFLKSGYRSPKSNQSLRNQGKTAAKTSTHIDGMAIDFYITGVDGKKMWDLIRSQDCCGAGNYGGNTVHLDSGRPRFWEKATSKVWSGESDFNRNIYLSVEYDRYRVGDDVRLFFTSVSDFGFGIEREIAFVTDKEGEEEIAKGKINSATPEKCLPINTRHDARFIHTTIPQGLTPGTYRVKVNFCNKPFEEMPEMRVSNQVEIITP